MKAFARSLFSSLRQMDCEASVIIEGYPTGLGWYGGYYRPDLKRPHTESSWTRRLAELLPERGYPTQAEVGYPKLARCRCDNVVQLPDGRRVWMENKGAWKQYWIDCGREWIYRSYLLHPLVPDLDQKSHTVPLDLEKLQSLTPRDADIVAILLVGFDSKVAPMTRDIRELKQLAAFGRKPWHEESISWRDQYRRGCRVSCWLWWRAVVAK